MALLHTDFTWDAWPRLGQTATRNRTAGYSCAAHGGAMCCAGADEPLPVVVDRSTPGSAPAEVAVRVDAPHQRAFWAELDRHVLTHVARHCAEWFGVGLSPADVRRMYRPPRDGTVVALRLTDDTRLYRCRGGALEPVAELAVGDALVPEIRVQGLWFTADHFGVAVALERGLVSDADAAEITASDTPSEDPPHLSGGSYTTTLSSLGSCTSSSTETRGSGIRVIRTKRPRAEVVRSRQKKKRCL